METIFPLDELGDLAAFAAVVDHNGFSAAARRLGLTKSAVSKRVSRLEQRLALRLLLRSTRAMSLTEAGRLLYAQAAPALAELAAARRLADGLAETPRGMLRVTASVTIGKLCLAPLLPEFLARYPEIDLRLILLDRFVDLVDEGFDLALRLTRSPPEQLVAKALMPVEYRLVATVDALQGRKIERPEDLEGLPGLDYHRLESPRADAARRLEWRFEKLGEAGGIAATVSMVRRVGVNNSEIVRELVLASQGVGLVWNHAVDRDIAAGRLLRLLPDWRPVGPFGQTAWAIWPQQSRLPLKTRVFIDYLAEKLGPAAPDQLPPSDLPTQAN